TSASGYMTRHDSRPSDSLEKCSSNKASRSRGTSSSACKKTRSSIVALPIRIGAPTESRHAVNANLAKTHVNLTSEPCVLDEIEIDVVEPERQREPRPEDPGPNLDELAGLRRLGEGKLERFRHRVG